MSEYSDRYLEMRTVKKVDGEAVTDQDGWTALAPVEALPLLTVGASYGLETKGGPFGIITGWKVGDRWFNRKTDQDLARQKQAMLDDMAQRARERLAEMRGEWIGREENLPGWLKERIHVFHERGGEKFELEGWGYELVICELAALYLDSAGEDTPEIDAYAEREGTSGNQHGCAKSLARAHAAGQTLAGTVAGLSPLTGNAFYEPEPVGGSGV